MHPANAAVLLVLLAATGGCSAARPPVVAPPPPDLSSQLADADELVRAGCYDCLRDALQQYERLLTTTAAAPESLDRAAAGAFRAAALLAIRERELGMVDGGYLTRARTLRTDRSCSGASMPCAAFDELLDVIEVLPPGAAGRVSRPPGNDAQMMAAQRLARSREQWSITLRGAASQDVLAAYVWLAFACNSTSNTRREAVEAVGPLAEMPLLQFEQVSCGALRADNLEKMLAGDPRFLETTYLLGLAKLGARDLDGADIELSRSYDWHPDWPVAALALANVAMTGEDFARALDFYEKALALEPHAVDALIGKVQALFYLGRYEASIAATDVMLAERWNLGSARYWRAFAELQLGRLDEGWSDVEEADRLLFNAAVPKLAGLIAYRRREADVARAKFEESRSRDSSDCETGYYLGQVLAEQGAWARTTEIFIDTAQCLAGSVAVLNLDIARIRNSQARPERKARDIERREQQIATLGRMRATSVFNTAVGFYNLARGDEARPYAELVVNDEQFGERARDLLSRLR